MLIPKAIFVDPSRNGVYGIAAVAVSLFAFAYSILFGQILVLAFYAFWLPLIFVDYRFVLGGLWHRPVLLLIPLYAGLSYFWSDVPSLTARASIQYATHIACAAVAARVLSTRTLSHGALIGVLLVLAYSLAVGRYVYDPIDGEYSFAGAFQSKNQLAFYASIGAVFGCYHALFVSRLFGVRVVGIAIAGFSIILLVMSKSATSMLVTPLALAILVAGRGMGLFSRGQKTVLLFFGAAVAVLALTAMLAAGIFDNVLALFGKDATLTGRTYLWDQGILLGGEAPIFGIGYQAFWIPGLAEAERLWAEFYIATRSGFHFHNTYIEAYVTLGIVGAILIAVPFVGSFILCLKLLVAGRDVGEPVLHLCLSVLLIVRSMVEVDVLFPYTVGSFLLFYSWARLLDLHAHSLVGRRYGRGAGVPHHATLRPLAPLHASERT